LKEWKVEIKKCVIPTECIRVEGSLTMKEHQYFVYIMASESGTLYIGVTSDLYKRVWQHKNDIIEGFTKKYCCHKLLYFEETGNVESAIAREKQLKKWNRSKKEFLISIKNPLWNDLSKEWVL
jgi:putative endonuclease